ncbi:MAG: DUF3857 and transglutaminase domain-containing protein [candidate division KSB1 bacterium]|nr:DUF3857 and transglutaminase domain-containing protein [candidate division KSB1 bacterium]MDZ7394023.1 DUF3857 and transglutaminase domain-containing protein [candidate division KSB1 bacterium]
MGRPFEHLIRAALLGLCAATTLTAQTEFSDEDIRKMVRESPRFSDFPEAGAVILLDQVVHEINPDGSATTSEHFLVKILRDRGKTKFADLKRTYNLRTDSMTVLLAQTRKRFGAPIPVEKDAINDITPPELADAAVYANFHQKVISYPEVVPNVCLELKRRTFHRPGEVGRRYFWGLTTLQTDEPVMLKEYTVVVPKGVAFSYRTIGQELMPTVAARGEKVAYTWRVENVSQLIPEPFMPPELEPRLLYTSCPSWEALGRWLGEQFEDKVQPTPAVQAKAADLTTGVQGEEEKVRAVYLWLVRQVRNVELPLGVMGYAPHQAERVLENMYGDWRDKAALLTALLKSVGVQAEVALLKRNGAPVVEELPTPEQFDAVYVRVRLHGGKVLWLDPFAQDCRYGYFPGGDGTQALVLTQQGGELVRVPAFDAETNSCHLRGSYSFANDGSLLGEEHFRLGGVFDRRLRTRVKDLTPKELEQFFARAASGVGEGTQIVSRTLSDLKDLNGEAALDWSYRAPDFAIAEGEMIICHLPPIAFEFLQVPPYRPTVQDRRNPFHIERECLFESERRFRLPVGYRVGYLPAPLIVENEFGRWSVEFRTDGQGQPTVLEKRTVTLKRQTMGVEQYAAYKKVYDDFMHRRNTIILMEKSR